MPSWDRQRTGVIGEQESTSIPSQAAPVTNAQPHNVMPWNNTQQNMAISNVNPSIHHTHGSLSFTDMNSSFRMNMGDCPTNRNNPSPVPHRSPNYQSHGHRDDEVHRLLCRVRELELERARIRSVIGSLGQPAAADEFATPSPSFQASWKARTEARKKIFCSINRAGNALCSWHDSRRERRVYPPRQAPPGFLNCGCSYEEALFEESLSRNNVGTYLPGGAMQMDPALRNPLLKLLEKRYGYKDGDFEHNPITERWAEGESPVFWEQKALSGRFQI